VGEGAWVSRVKCYLFARGCCAPISHYGKCGDRPQLSCILGSKDWFIDYLVGSGVAFPNKSMTSVYSPSGAYTVHPVCFEAVMERVRAANPSGSRQPNATFVPDSKTSNAFFLTGSCITNSTRSTRNTNAWGSNPTACSSSPFLFLTLRLIVV
jgi:hypothetical protein